MKELRIQITKAGKDDSTVTLTVRKSDDSGSRSIVPVTNLTVTPEVARSILENAIDEALAS